jgi:hypothetical protein
MRTISTFTVLLSMTLTLILACSCTGDTKPEETLTPTGTENTADKIDPAMIEQLSDAIIQYIDSKSGQQQSDDIFSIQQQNEKNADIEKIAASDDIDFNGMHIYWQTDVSVNSEENAVLSLFVNAEKNANGEFVLDDGNEWLLLMKYKSGDYPLFPRQYVQLGKVSCDVFFDNADILHILITVAQGANHKIYDCFFDNESNEIWSKSIYNAENINVLARSEPI